MAVSNTKVFLAGNVQKVWDTVTSIAEDRIFDLIHMCFLATVLARSVHHSDG